MTISNLIAISPVDGRYADKVNNLREMMSEYGLMRYRLRVEIAWLQLLSDHPDIKEVPTLNQQQQTILTQIYQDFTEKEALQIKAIEKKTNHDVKAIEYYIKEKLAANKQLANISEFIHFACTSEDINNLAYALMLQAVRKQCLLPLMEEIIHVITDLAHEHANISMLARTHGQPATPTTVGKEFANFAARLKRQRHHLANLQLYGKMNGAVGNYNAHVVAYPEINWPLLAKKFVESFGLTFNPYTTQIDPHDYVAEFSHVMIQFNNIIKDLTRDLWGYIALDYFKQKLISNEVGSSTMPHKINPIDFENAEGNVGIANALFNYFANQLPTSRWQRDLVDSTVLRNLGSAIAHSMIAYQALLKGLNKINVNQEKIIADLNQHWEILGEAIQTMMRRYGLKNPYEQLKEFTRGKQLDAATVKAFIDQLDIPAAAKTRLFALTPVNYIGLADQLAKEITT